MQDDGQKEETMTYFPGGLGKTPIFYYIWDEFDDRIVSISESSRRIA
jgi:hypothetical protein